MTENSTPTEAHAFIFARIMADCALQLVGGQGLNFMIPAAHFDEFSDRAKQLRTAVENYNSHILSLCNKKSLSSKEQEIKDINDKFYTKTTCNDTKLESTNTKTRSPLSQYAAREIWDAFNKAPFDDEHGENTALAVAFQVASDRMCNLIEDGCHPKYLEGVKASQDFLNNIASELEKIHQRETNL